MSKIICFVQCMATPHGVYPIDDVVEVEDGRAQELIRQGIALEVTDDRDKPKFKEHKVETATVDHDVETASKPTPKVEQPKVVPATLTTKEIEPKPGKGK